MSLRLLTPKGATPPTEPVLLFAEIRNNTDEPITIHRPFGQDEASWRDIRVTRPDGVQITGRLESPGNMPFDMFKALGPGVKWLDVMELKARAFQGIDQVGKHSVEFTYVVESTDASRLEYQVEHPGRLSSLFHADPPICSGRPPDSTAPSSEGSQDVPPLWIGEIHSAPITFTRGE